MKTLSPAILIRAPNNRGICNQSSAIRLEGMAGGVSQNGYRYSNSVLLSNESNPPHQFAIDILFAIFHIMLLYNNNGNGSDSLLIKSGETKTRSAKWTPFFPHGFCVQNLIFSAIFNGEYIIYNFPYHALVSHVGKV